MPLFYATADYFLHPRLPVAIFRRDHGVACLPHYHHFHEIVFVLRGWAVHVVDGCTHEFGAGEMLLVCSGQVHHYREVRDLELISILLLPQLPDALADELPGVADCEEMFLSTREGDHYRGHLAPDAQEFGKALEQIQALEAELLHLPKSCQRVMDRFSSLWKAVARCCASSRARESDSRRITHFEAAEHRIAPAIDHLERHFAEAVRLDDLADLTAMPARTLFRQFQKVTGRSPFVYLHDLRLHHAMLELKQSRKSVTAVALDVGYNDLSFFNHKFKSLTGLPPTVWRQKVPHAW